MRERLEQEIKQALDEAVAARRDYNEALKVKTELTQKHSKVARDFAMLCSPSATSSQHYRPAKNAFEANQIALEQTEARLQSAQILVKAAENRAEQLQNQLTEYLKAHPEDAAHAATQAQTSSEQMAMMMQIIQVQQQMQQQVQQQMELMQGQMAALQTQLSGRQKTPIGQPSFLSHSSPAHTTTEVDNPAREDQGQTDAVFFFER